MRFGVMRALQSILRTLRRHPRAILWASLILAASVAIHDLMSTAYVEIEIHAERPTGISIYWAGENQNYSEKRVHHTRIYPHNHHYKLLIGDLDNIRRIRFDPLTNPGRVLIREFSIYEYGHDPLRLRDPASLSQLQPFRHIDDWHIGKGGLAVESASHDPQLQLILDEPPAPTGGFVTGFAWRVAGFIFLCVLIARSLKWIARDYQFVPYVMLVAFTLIMIMATTSRINAHPDEYVHILAARYYIDHDRPPPACAEDTLHTYSPYGVSRLNSLEISYFLTGKFAGALGFLPISESFRLRYFNLSLFALLVILSVRSIPFRLICLPVLASPQVWYVFSYVNSDAFALFTTLIAAHQLVSPESMLRNALADARARNRLPRFIGLGSLAAALLLIKKNFFVADLFMGIWVALVYLMATDRRVWIYVKRLAPAVVVSMLLLAWWLYAHEAANDFNRGPTIEQCSERMAHDSYRRHAPPEKLSPTLYWRDKGLPFTALFEHHWGTKVFYSSFGHFGYLEILGPPTYYQLVAVLLLVFVAYLLYDVMRSGSRIDKFTVLAGIGMFCLILSLTLWKAWTKDFQPQGRYFFPMVTIIGMTLAVVRASLRPRIVSSLFVALFLLSTYFFVFVGLLGIRKF